MKRRKLIPVLLLVLAAGGFYYWEKTRPTENDGPIASSGHVETTEVDLSFRLPGLVDRLLVEEGDRIAAGELLAELEREVYLARVDQAEALIAELEASLKSLDVSIKIKEEVLQAEVKRAEAAVSAAEAVYESLKTGSREEEIAQAEAARDRARTEFENLEKEYRRLDTLYTRGAVSASRRDQAQTAYEAARAALEAAEEQLKLVIKGPRREAVRQGRAQVEGSEAALKAARAAGREVEKLRLDRRAMEARADQARASLAAARDDLAHTRLKAPFDGFVTVKDVEEKEFVQAGAPVLTLTRLDQVWVRTFVPETRLGQVRLGGRAEVYSDSFPDKVYRGKITFISPKAEFTPKNVQTAEERVKLVYRIKVTLENPERELKPGMPVDVLLPRAP